VSGNISIVGLGPGGLDWFAPGAMQALQSADIILGYQKYLEQIDGVLPHIPRVSSGMRHEVERARMAIGYAEQGKNVALVSGGDAGIYGMAGLVFELMALSPEQHIHVEVLAGISALNAAAALLGAPLMTDFAVISLSDYLIPLETILNRLRVAIDGDFVVCLYNPRSHQRVEPFTRAMALMIKELGEERPVGLVQAAYRREQKVTVTCLREIARMDIGMDSLLIIGNKSTRVLDGKLVTPRGYPLQADKEIHHEA
jgi:precorrin-3B C17-methyltransferase